MDKATISKRIGEIRDDVTRLSHTLFALDGTDIQRFPENYDVLVLDAALRGEQIACRMRHLVYASTGIRKHNYLQSAGRVQGIRIVYEDDVLAITLPALLPGRKTRQSTELLTDPLYFTLSEYAASQPMPHYRHCIVCFSHVYARDLPSRRIRDYDNVELKQILDVVSSFILVDDTGLLCDAYNTTELGETDCTIIHVMDKERFSGWLDSRENDIKTISDF